MTFGSLLAIGLLAVGCGGSGDETTALTKSAYMKQAEAICKSADKSQEKLAKGFIATHPKAIGNKEGQEELVVAAGIEPTKVETEELAELSPPSGQEAEVEAIVESLEKALEEVEANPLSMTETATSDPFGEAKKLAREYGFKACAEPI